MPKRLILLTGAFDAEVLLDHLRSVDPRCPVTWVTTREELADAARLGAPARLVSFCSGVIVPRALLGRMDGPSYNIHPGPPTFPGRYPECWGAYHGAGRFGATLHVMAPRVDEGMIVDTRWFDVPPGAGQKIIGREAFLAAMALFADWAPAFATRDAPLPGNGEVWSGVKSRLVDIEAMSVITPDIDAEEFERRRRAFAELPGCNLYLELHGRSFVYTPEPFRPGED